jgi:hypothetical protein
MSGTILFVGGGNSFARSVFVRERRALWSDAFPFALEKHGFLGVDVAGPDALADPGVSDRYALIIVGRIPPSAWTADVAKRLMAGSAYVIVEGPPPSAVADAVRANVVMPDADRNGTIIGDSGQLVEAALQYGMRPEGTIADFAASPVERVPGLDWQDRARVPIDADTADAWLAPGWDVALLSADAGSEVLARWLTPDGETHAAIVRRGRLVSLSAGLLGVIGQAYTSPPYPRGQTLKGSGIARVEAVVFGLMDVLHRWTKVARPRLLPWPNGASWVRSIRHDYDRSLTPAETADVLQRHDECGSVATWYWRARHARDPAMQVVAASRHEVALHSEALWTDQDERQEVEAALGRRVDGVSAHGTDESFRFQGAANAVWAEEENLVYTEHLDQDHHHPHRLVILDASGRLRPLRVLGLPHHRSFDYSSTEHNGTVIRREPARWIAAAGMLQVMNHPDIHHDAFFAALNEMPSAGRLDWTASRAARWWRRTHVSGNLRIDRTPEGFEIGSRTGVNDAVLEIQDPDGYRILTRTSVPRGGSTTIEYAPRG